MEWTGQWSGQLGLDIATSLSVIFAALSIFFSSRKQRAQSERHYVLESMKNNLHDYYEKLKEWNGFAAEWRLNVYEITMSAGTQQEKQHEMKNVIEVVKLKKILFLENLHADLEYQSNVFFRMFVKNTPAKFDEYMAQCKSLIDLARDGDREADKYRNSLYAEAQAGGTLTDPATLNEIKAKIDQKHPPLELQAERLLTDIINLMAQLLKENIR